MNERQHSTALVVEVDPNQLIPEERDLANDICDWVDGKCYRIITFWIEDEGTEELVHTQGLIRARISYFIGNNRSPNDWQHYQVEEILPVETAID